MRKNHNIFYLALYVGSAVGMVGSGIAVFLYQMLGSHTDLLNFLFGLFVLFFFVFLIVNIALFIKILMFLYKDRKTDKSVDDNKKKTKKKQPIMCTLCQGHIEKMEDNVCAFPSWTSPRREFFSPTTISAVPGWANRYSLYSHGVFRFSPHWHLLWL